jgi:hypothetical protein
VEDVLLLKVRELSGPRARPQISIYLFHAHDCGWRGKSGIAKGFCGSKRVLGAKEGAVGRVGIR